MGVPTHGSPDLLCDWDFGATVNVGINDKGVATFLGAASKGGTYYLVQVLPGRGPTPMGDQRRVRWFISRRVHRHHGLRRAPRSLRVDRHRQLRRLRDRVGKSNCCAIPAIPRTPPSNSRRSTPSSPHPGRWPGRSDDSPSFAPTTVAGGMTFNGPALDANVLGVRDAQQRQAARLSRVPGPIWSGSGHGGWTRLITGVGSVGSTAQPAGVAVSAAPGGAPRSCPDPAAQPAGLCRALPLAPERDARR